MNRGTETPWEPQLRPTRHGCTVQPVRRDASGGVAARLEHWFLIAGHSNVAKHPRSLRAAKRSLRLCADFCAERNHRERRAASFVDLNVPRD